MTDGGFRPDGSFYHLPGFNSRHLERLSRAEILRMLVDKGLIGEETVRNLLAWRHSGFSIHGAVRVEDRQGAARLGRYMIRCPLALNRLSWNDDTVEVAYTARPTRRSGPSAGRRSAIFLPCATAASPSTGMCGSKTGKALSGWGATSTGAPWH